MKASLAVLDRHAGLLAGALVLLGLYLASLHRYLLFHSLTELFAVVVACGIFMIVWNSRRFLDNHYLLLVGIAYLFVAFLDVLHTLTYQGLGALPGSGVDPSVQLWVAARYLQSVSLLIAPLFITRRLNVRAAFVCYGVAVGLVLLSIFYWNIFPACYVEGVGVTPFKWISGFVIIVFLSVALGLLGRRRHAFDAQVWRLLVASIGMTIAAELAFAFRADVYGTLNVLGHFLRVTAFYLIYKAVVETGLTKPYGLLFRDLKQSEQKLKREHDFTSAVLNTAGALVVVLDHQGRIVDFNRACEQSMGYLFEEVQGRPFWELFLIPEEVEPVKSVFDRLRAGRFPNEFENYWVTRDGDRRLIAWSNTAIVDEHGVPEYVIGTGIDITERKRAELENVRLYEKERRLAVLEERQRLARDLHDSVSQSLYGIVLGARTARAVLDDQPERAAEPLDYILSMAEMGLTEMRALIFELRPDSLETEGLVAALSRQAASVQARHGTPVRTDLCAEPDLSLDVKEALYRIAQEAMNNAVKHAGPSQVSLMLTCAGNAIMLEVSDDGIGFDPAGQFPGHMGLQSMSERARLSGGVLDIESAPGGGTRIRARIPHCPAPDNPTAGSDPLDI